MHAEKKQTKVTHVTKLHVKFQTKRERGAVDTDQARLVLGHVAAYINRLVDDERMTLL